jgi:hypothetical protein
MFPQHVHDGAKVFWQRSMQLDTLAARVRESQAFGV